MAPPLLSFVIPVRNDAARLETCLASIRADAGLTPVEIIVADNGSTDASADVARANGATVLSLPSRPVSEVRNAAARSAQSDYLAFVDADHHLGSGWIAAALESLSDDRVSVAGAEYHAPRDGTWVQRAYDLFRDHEALGPRVVDWLPSGNIVVRRTLFERVHGFDTALESCEDVDFCRRVREAGGRIVSQPALHSTHVGDPPTLKALFLAELWRGRDNLRVSLRERLTPRNAPSVLFPVLHLGALGLVVGGGAIWMLTGGSVWVMLVGLSTALALSSVRAIRMWDRSRRPTDRPALDPGRIWIVAVTYDIARALALVARAGHDVRKRS